MSKPYIIHMFNKHVTEITSYLDHIVANGYTHILISPIVICNPDNVGVWWGRYQPQSYEIGSSTIGSYDEIKTFIKKCADKNIRVLCDVVINHMARYGLDITKDSTYDVYGLAKAKPTDERAKVQPKILSQDNFSYTWSAKDFNTYGKVVDKLHGYDITNWNDPQNYRTRWLLGLPDLNDWSENVKFNRRVFMDELAIMGFAGLRIDAVKHVQPFAIFDLVNEFVQAATGSNFQSLRNLQPFRPSDIVIVCESLSNGNDYADTFHSYMTEFMKLSIPRNNILFYDNVSQYPIKEAMKNLNSDNFAIQTQFLNLNLGMNALHYLCTHDIAHNMESAQEYICNPFVNTLFYGLMYLVNRNNVMVFNDDEFAYTSDIAFDKTLAKQRISSDNYTKEFQNKYLGEIVKFSKVLDTAKNLDIKRFKYGPNLVYTFDKLGLFVFSFTGCTFDQKAMKSMNLDGFESHTDAFTGKSIKDYKLGPYCCALFTKAMPPPPPVVTPPPVITPPPTKTDPNANKTYNFEVDFELDINESKPTVSIKKATYVG